MMWYVAIFNLSFPMCKWPMIVSHVSVYKLVVSDIGQWKANTPSLVIYPDVVMSECQKIGNSADLIRT